MTTKAKWIIAIVAILGVGILAAFGAMPYGYMLQGFWMSADGGSNGIIDAAWALYIAVAVLLALALWRMLYVAVSHRPKR